MFWDTMIYQISLELFLPFWQITRWGRSVLLRGLHFYWVFGFCWSTRRVSSYFLIHTLTSCWCGMLCWSYGFLRWRCRRCRWRWAWRACRLTKDNEWYVVRRVAFLFVCHFWWAVSSDHWSNGNYTRVKELPVYLREALLSRINPIPWHTLVPLLLLAPRRWLLPQSDFLRSLRFPTPFLLTICMIALSPPQTLFPLVLWWMGPANSSVGENTVALSFSLSV